MWGVRKERGELHQRLISLLNEQIDVGACTQESIGSATGKKQATVSGILKRNKGTFDLDEAAAALEHVGSSLRDFVAGVPPRVLTHGERMGRALATRSDLYELVEDLLSVPKPKLDSTIELVRQVARLASARRPTPSGEPPTADRRATRTRRGRARHR